MLWLDRAEIMIIMIIYIIGISLKRQYLYFIRYYKVIVRYYDGVSVLLHKN